MISRVPTAVDRDEAGAIVDELSGELSASVTEQVLYPYHRVLLRYSAKTLLGETALKVVCLVDARTGVASTSDPFEIVRFDAGGERVIEPTVCSSDARAIAERHASVVVRNRRKALVFPTIDVLGEDVIYKPFWIVRCTDGSKPSFRVLVDGVTGGICVLGPAGRRLECARVGQPNE